MPIKPFIQDLIFDPEAIVAMSEAFESALAELGLTDRTDALTELVAKRIISIAAEGERDPAKLCERALYNFRAANPEGR